MQMSEEKLGLVNSNCKKAYLRQINNTNSGGRDGSRISRRRGRQPCSEGANI